MSESKKPVKLKYKIPKTVGGAIDLLYTVRAARKKAQAVSEAEKAQEKLIENHIFNGFKKSDLEGARGKLAQASISRSDVPTFKNDKAFFAYVKKTGDFDLLQRRLSVEACRERWAAKKTIPGVEVFTVMKLSLSKVK